MIKAIDHIVLSANDLGKTIWFYCDVLGMELQRFTPPAGGDERLALGFGSNKINLHDVRKPFEPHTRNPTIGSLDICFLSDKPVDQWREHVLRFDIPIELGPVQRTGATGPLLSIYLRDPDGNLVEISNTMD
ncbi:MAG: VOC family protein [Alphaproteobacteria bacterium]|jgi:catechol 2,3-dioxygenase-like lactoylglutathione lyase family enzyme|nr:VOC family protein [Alphaproteobacteria bacterium]